MSKPRLPTLETNREGIGAPTIMDPALAASHGAPYVHLAAFAIDVDRVRALLEETEPEHDLPFGWEVFLTEVYILSFLDLEDEVDRTLVEDACLALVHGRPTKGPASPPLGAQLPFAVYDAVRRGAAPASLSALFRTWGTRAEPLVRALAPLWEDPGSHLAALADLCLDVPLRPPVAEPTARALDELHDRAVGGEDDDGDEDDDSDEAGDGDA